MTAPLVESPNMAPPAPRKRGCGCFTGCLAFLGIVFIFLIGSGVALWYAFQNAGDISDKMVQWTYYNVARPQIIENLPPNLKESEKERILNTSDNAVNSYLTLPPQKKKVLLKEAFIAVYYYSQDQIIPPNQIPNLQKFIEEQVGVYQGRPPRLRK